MGYSGLIYAAIVAAWAAFLVPRWVRRNEEVERAREADTARGVRVLQRRSGPMHAPHASVTGADERTVLHGDESGLSVGAPVGRDRKWPDAPARRGDWEVDHIDAVFAEAARRRRRMLAVLLTATAIALVTAFIGRAPGWLPVVTVLLTGFFLLMARRAAVAQARRRRLAARRRPAQPEHAVWASASSDDSADGEQEVAADAPLASGRRLVIPDEAEEPVDPHAWQPVPVPLPTYVTKPKAPRVERTIDLSRPGSWTSGRLDPVGSVELPRREADERSRNEADERRSDAASHTDAASPADEAQEHRRAVGD